MLGIFSLPTLSRQFNFNAKVLNEYIINLRFDEQMNHFFKISLDVQPINTYDS